VGSDSGRRAAPGWEAPGGFPPKKRLYDFDGLYDPDCGSDDDFDNPHGDWLVFG
jgi:hypothetical protein